MLEQIGMTEKYKGWMDEVRSINTFYSHIQILPAQNIYYNNCFVVLPFYVGC